MSVTVNQVGFYVDEKGRSPFDEWLDGLANEKALAAVLSRIARMKLGNAGYCRDLADGVWEMKIDLGPGYRVYFARADRTLYLLLAGGDKSTQNADIRLAKKYWKEYKKRTQR